MTATEILQKISEGGYLAVLRGPTLEYKELISVCHADGVAACTLSRELLNDLVEADLVKQDGSENQSKVTVF